ncbi:hypothetical protein Tco_0748599 [Tanacetum coccineum]|uniref:Uncharacterized protein n=1 Tax=Tanacetum coccineum TaxID=301880 RepID=A0ABQ4YZH8_9ASTR
MITKDAEIIQLEQQFEKSNHADFKQDDKLATESLEMCNVRTHGLKLSSVRQTKQVNAQEEGFDFEEAFALVLPPAWKTVRIFVAPTQQSKTISNLSDWTVKPANLNGPQKEEFMMLSARRFVDPDHRQKRQYALEILKKHNMDNCHSIGTVSPLATKPKLDVDLELRTRRPIE